MTSRSVLKRIETVLRDQLGAQGRLALHEPWFNGNESAYVQDCITSGWVSSVGSYVDRFEKDVARLSGTAFAIATVNGTAALHVALQLAGVGPGDLVLCPPLTFIGTVNAIAYCGAQPCFVDVDAATLGIDPAKVEAFLNEQCRLVDGKCIHTVTGRPVTALVPVHIFGHPVDMDPLTDVARRYGIAVVEDACESIGSTYRGRPCGSLSDMAVLSFNGNKVVTTGGGGAIVTDNPELARRAKHLTTTARVAAGSRFIHDEVGYNYRLPNLNAALGCAQLETLADRLDRKRRLTAFYGDALREMSGVRLFLGQDWACSNYWLNALVFDDGNDRDEFLVLAGERNLETRPCWELMCDLPMYRDAPRADGLTRSRHLQPRIANIPSSPQLVP